MYLFLYRPRSRGKITVEDEDSMDGLETTETENIVETGIKLNRFLKMYIIICTISICLYTEF